MIFNYILLFFTLLLLFAVSLLPEDYKATNAIVWLAVSTFIILALVYPDAGKGWF
jgi:predicted membrane-bound dolichyl-phosphate-mannose-protein mannosyltransferase